MLKHVKQIMYKTSLSTIPYSIGNLIRDSSRCVYQTFCLCVCACVYVYFTVVSVYTSWHRNFTQVKPVWSPLCFLGTSLFVVVCLCLCVHVQRCEPAIFCIHDFKVNGEPTNWLHMLLLQLSTFNQQLR